MFFEFILIRLSFRFYNYSSHFTNRMPMTYFTKGIEFCQKKSEEPI